MRYTDEQRQQAVDLYTEHGTAEASRRTGIPRRTIRRWANQAGAVAAANTKETEAATRAARIQAAWGDYREQEALQAGGTAARARRRVAEALDAGDHQVIRAAAIAYGILIDKAELLSGRATERIESWSESELDRELRDLVRRLETRSGE